MDATLILIDSDAELARARLPRKQPAARPPRRTRRNDRCGTERKRVTPPGATSCLGQRVPVFSASQVLIRD